MKLPSLRVALQGLVLGTVVYLAFGKGDGAFEAYCPFGGVESLWGLFTTGGYTCALAPLNLSMLVAVLALALVAKKAFCGWACPIGFLGELAARLGKRLGARRLAIPPAAGRWLKRLRYAVLAVALVFTYRTGELVLRGYDPYYLLFSGFGHGTAGWVSMAVLAALVLGALAVPLLFCRYLCPLGAVFDPFSRFGLIRIAREAAHCTGCGQCGRACPHEIPVPTLAVVSHRDCTHCHECLRVCPEKAALRLELRMGK